MPGFTTHYLLGQQTYKHLQPSLLKHSIHKYHTIFSLGQQGPDIFFYNLPTLVSKSGSPGSIAHTTETKIFLKNLLESPKLFITKKEQQIARIYALGFIGHYLLDTTCHPYIYAMTHYTMKTTGYIGQHIRLETDIDTTLLWFYLRKHPCQFPQSLSILLSKDELRIASLVLYFALSKTYPTLSITRQQILSAIRSIQKRARFLQSPFIFHKDPCNRKHSQWQNPWNKKEKSSESFFVLFEKTQTRYLHLMEEFQELFSHPSADQSEIASISLLLSQLGNQSYHSGLPSASNLP